MPSQNAVSTDNAPAIDVLRAVRACALAWEPDARILGNVRAIDIARAVAEIDREQALRRDTQKVPPANLSSELLQKMQQLEKEEQTMVRHRDIAITEAAHDLLVACEMEAHNEAIFTGKWKHGSKAWNGEFVLRLKADAMARVKALTEHAR